MAVIMAQPPLEDDAVSLLNEMVLDNNDHDEADHDESNLSFKHIRRLLFTSHFLSTWNSRAFEFGAFLFLALIYPDTLFPASIYALSRAGTAAILAPWTGRLVDHQERLFVVRLSIVGQRVAVALSCAILLVALHAQSVHSDDTIRSTIFLVILCLLAAIEKCSAMLNTIAVERDWVVVIAGNNTDHLRDLNSQMRRIDLFCKLIAPLAVSFIAAASTRAGIWTVGLMTGVSAAVEYIAIARVYASIPRLRSTVHITRPAASELPRPRSSWFHTFAAGLRYFKHPAFLPSFALALLYLTVLSFSGQLITYLIAQGVRSWEIGLLRAAAAVFELSATWLAPKLMQYTGPIRSGIWFLNIEVICVSLAVSLLWFGDSEVISIYGMVVAVIFSRIGLWGFDLSAQIIIQEEVEEDFRGAFSSQEFAFQNIFEMLAFASTALYSNPVDFKFPALFSAIAVAFAAVLYAIFVRDRRGHLLHLSRCIDRDQKDHRHTGRLRVVRRDNNDP